MALPDTQLVLRVREGVKLSLAELLAKYRTPVIHFIYRMVQDQHLAEQLATDVFRQAAHARKTRPEPGRWLFGVATEITLRALRQFVVAPGPVPGTSGGTIREAVQQLPPRERAVLLLHKYHALDSLQIAQVLGCSESSANSLLFRAYQGLRRRTCGARP